MNNKQHEFALYVPGGILCSKKEDARLTITNADLWHRVARVLRLGEGDRVTFFDDHKSVTIELGDLSKTKNSVYGPIIGRQLHQPLQPSITLLLGMTKKPAFEDSLYAAAQLGVDAIVPVMTKKSAHWYDHQRDGQRLRSVMIAACEQSKQFLVPKLMPVKPLDGEMLASLDEESRRIYFAPGGASLRELSSNAIKHDIVFVGAEGGLTDEEEALLAGSNFVSYRLTPTILRTQDAVLVGVGCLRSLV